MKRFEYLSRKVHFSGRNPADDAADGQASWDGMETTVAPTLAELG
jgi:hypothetical protein